MSKTAGLTPAARVEAAFRKQRIDKIATYHTGWSSKIGSDLLGRDAYVGGGINQWRESVALWDGPAAHAEYVERTRRDSYDLAKIIRNDLIRISYWRMTEKPARKIDTYTFLYGNPDGDYVVRQMDPETELYQVIDERKSHVPQTVDDLEASVTSAEKSLANYRPTKDSYREQLGAVEYFGPDYAIPAPGYGLCIPRDPLWLEATLLRPDLVERHLDYQCTVACRQIEALKDLPLPYILGGGDFCGNNGPLYSPRIFHEMMLPRLKKMSETAHRCRKYVGFASDGNLWPIADDLFGASGTDAFYEIDHDAGMDLRKLRTKYPNLTCFGNISSATLHNGTRERVIAETRENAEIALELGGCLCGVSNQVVAPTPMANVMAMLETLEKYR